MVRSSAAGARFAGEAPDLKALATDIRAALVAFAPGAVVVLAFFGGCTLRLALHGLLGGSVGGARRLCRLSTFGTLGTFSRFGRRLAAA